MHRSNLLALGAILLWASLATLGLRLSHLPPFWLTGVALLMGSVIAVPLSGFDFSQWRVPLRTLALGVYGLFGFHFLLFIALRHAPPVQANLVNYLWPLGMVVLAQRDEQQEMEAEQAVNAQRQRPHRDAKLR